MPIEDALQRGFQDLLVNITFEPNDALSVIVPAGLGLIQQPKMLLLR